MRGQLHLWLGYDNSTPNLAFHNDPVIHERNICLNKHTCDLFFTHLLWGEECVTDLEDSLLPQTEPNNYYGNNYSYRKMLKSFQEELGWVKQPFSSLKEDYPLSVFLPNALV